MDEALMTETQAGESEDALSSSLVAQARAVSAAMAITAEDTDCDGAFPAIAIAFPAITIETARQRVRQASLIAEVPSTMTTRWTPMSPWPIAFERAALRLKALGQKAIGLRAFLRPNSRERLIRDLTTYMRLPALDLSVAAEAALYLRQRDNAFERR